MPLFFKAPMKKLHNIISPSCVYALLILQLLCPPFFFKVFATSHSYSVPLLSLPQSQLLLCCDFSHLRLALISNWMTSANKCTIASRNEKPKKNRIPNQKRRRVTTPMLAMTTKEKPMRTDNTGHPEHGDVLKKTDFWRLPL